MAARWSVPTSAFDALGKGLTLNSILRIGLALGLFLLPVLPAEATGAWKHCEAEVRECLDHLKVSPADISGINYEKQRTGSRNKSNRILAWVSSAVPESVLADQLIAGAQNKISTETGKRNDTESDHNQLFRKTESTPGRIQSQWQEIKSAKKANEDGSRRMILKRYAVKEFSSSSNHCKSFAHIAEHTANIAPSVGAWFEDLRLVLIGEDWLRRPGRRGPFYMGIMTNDSGFKPELRDGSPQVEHAFAAIYFGKVLSPGGTTFWGSLIEIKDAFVRKTSVNNADILLWGFGEEIGTRLSPRNLNRVAISIRKTLCAP